MSQVPDFIVELERDVADGLERLKKTGGEENFARRQKGLREELRAAFVALLCSPIVAVIAIGATAFAAPFVVYALVVLSAALMAWGVRGTFWDLSFWRQPENWAPLSSNPARCEEALELVRTHRAAREIRDRALASGRQLYVVDALVMCMAAQLERIRAEQEHKAATQEHSAEEHRQRCAELHGLA